MEIICPLMDNDRMSNDVFRIKAIRIHCRPGVPGICQQRRKITGMGWVYGILRVIMAAGRREFSLRILRTCIAGMNAESMEAIAVLCGFCRKPPNRCHSHCSSICIVKIDSSFDIRMVLVSFDYCISRRIRFDIYHV